MLTGAAGNDPLNGGTGNDTLSGSTGNDSMTGDDLFYVDSTTDIVIEAAGGGTDTLSTTVTYTLGAEVEVLLLTGSTAMDGTGNGLANQITGNNYANLLQGLAGNDTLTANDGDDTLDGGAGSDSIVGGKGNDLFLFDNAGDLAIEANKGGTGADLLSGGAGIDAFVFVTGDGLDVITDFVRGVDVLTINSTVINIDATPPAGVTKAVDAAGDITLTYGGAGNVITLQGLHPIPAAFAPDLWI